MKVSKTGLLMTSVYLSSVQREALKRIGRREGISAAAALRRLLDAGLQSPVSGLKKN